jgi:hypothetical protein
MPEYFTIPEIPGSGDNNNCYKDYPGNDCPCNHGRKEQDDEGEYGQDIIFLKGIS